MRVPEAHRLKTETDGRQYLNIHDGGIMRKLGLSKAQMGHSPNEGTRTELVQLELKKDIAYVTNYRLK